MCLWGKVDAREGVEGEGESEESNVVGFSQSGYSLLDCLTEKAEDDRDYQA